MKVVSHTNLRVSLVGKSIFFLDLNVQYVLDAKKLKNPRMFFLPNENNIVNETITLEHSKKSCKTMYVFIKVSCHGISNAFIPHSRIVSPLLGHKCKKNPLELKLALMSRLGDTSAISNSNGLFPNFVPKLINKLFCISERSER